ncbi:hypothetical protein F7D01_07875 [Erythrobacter sp. 3-20A1M]|uniref:hypothetical protein n=1 Tax=Erythrobacter sp. 3-20A1M TaxID=2653850 RepID=UPI001BFCD310|nr:hypothetical protein [Erythrobacter sp. 3-20A1M]QWC57018.1 hypothetical protein F7D01_07875 [Erythrobacter sp. 3-20A1M]
MSTDYRNRTDWLTPLLALSVWAAHFSLLWAASSIFPGQLTARWIAAALTAIAGGIIYLLWRQAQSRALTSAPGLGLAIATLGIAFDFAPALLA